MQEEHKDLLKDHSERLKLLEVQAERVEGNRESCRMLVKWESRGLQHGVWFCCWRPIRDQGEKGHSLNKKHTQK